MKAIETIYNGYRFRSRLEARWAVFFDALGVAYEYEPEGFELDNGMWYLPDFILHGVVPRARCDVREEITDLYVEVKGEPNAKDAQKIYEFSKNKPVWVVGALPDPDNYIISCEKQREEYCKRVCNGELPFEHHCVFCPYCYGTIDGDSCFGFSLGFDQHALSFHGADSSYSYGLYFPEIEKALREARSARFEFDR